MALRRGITVIIMVYLVPALVLMAKETKMMPFSN